MKGNSVPITKAEGSDLNSVAVKILRNAARQSSCRRRQVGAALFDVAGNLLAVGWNNERPFPNGTNRSCMEGDCPRGMAPYATIPADSPYSDCISEHAEMMALSKYLGQDPAEVWGPLDMYLFVTHKPCHECSPILERLDLPVFYLEEM